MALVQRIKLDPGSDEYQEVARRFNSRYMVEGMKCELLGVERVYNESLEQRFAERRQQYQKMYGHVDIKKGWHGTKEENVASILKNNFDVSKNAVRRHRYGAGVSFSSLPSYASYYCDKTSEASMLLADVLVSNAVAVAENKGRLVRAPPRLPGSTLHYDTTAKSLDRMDVFVKSDKDAFLPTHVVRFRRGDSEPRDAATPARHHADLSHSLASLALDPSGHDHGRQSDWDHCDGLFDYGADDDFICDLSDDNMSDYYGEDYEDCDYLSDYGVEDHEDCDRDSDNGDEGYNCESDHVFTLSDETWQVAPYSHGVNLSDQGDEENNYAYVDGYSDDGDEGYNYACGPVDDFSYPGDQDGPFHYDLGDADDHGNQDGTFGDLDYVDNEGDQEALYDDHDPVCEGGDLGDVHDPGYQDDPYDVFGDVHDAGHQDDPYDVLGDVHDAVYQDDPYDVLGDVHDAGYQDDPYDVLGDVHDAGYQDDPYDVLGDVHDPGNDDFFDDY